MNANQRIVVNAFLAELDGLKLNEPDVPLHIVDRRLLLAQHVLDDLRGDDLEELAIREVAVATQALCWSPRDVDTLKRYVAARRGHLEVLKALLGE